MSKEIFKLKTLDVEQSVIRQSRVGFKNNPTSKLVISSPDTGSEFYAGETGIYSGERDVNTEYLLQGSIDGNNIRTEATFTKGSKEVTLSNPISGLKEGDIVRNDLDNTFFEIKEVTGTVITLLSDYTSTNFEGTTFTGSATLRKEKMGNAEFEYVRSLDGENKIFFNQDRLEWGITGLETEGPIDTQSDPYVFPSDDYMVASFQNSSTNGAPVITAVKSENFTVVNDNKDPVSDLSLPAVPYPHETLKVYWGPKDGGLAKKEEWTDYVVNYTQNPDFLFPFPPMEERQVAFLKFLFDLDESQGTIDEDFQGYVAVTKTTEVPGANNLVTSITDIVQDTEEIKVSESIVDKNKDYSIDYRSGLITFIKHINNEQLIQSVSYPRSLLWDGVTVIRGVKEDQVVGDLNPTKNEDLVIRPITGLAGIEGTVYYEDTDANNLEKDVDYILAYDAGAIRINQTLEEGESVLVTYYVEGVQEENEDLLEAEDLRIKKFPVMAGSSVLTKVYTGVDNVDQTIVLSEGTDYEINNTTGVVKPLADSLVGENVKSLNISYIPMALTNVIIQPNTEDSNTYRFTIVDDALEVESPFALKFKVRNPQVSVPENDPFLSDDDPNKVSYNSTIIEGSILSVGIRVRSGLGTVNEELLEPGVTSTDRLGVITDIEFDTNGYTYDNEVKEIRLDESLNEARPDFNDVIVATYSFIGDTLPYKPVEALFPVILEGSNNFYIEGLDRTDLLKAGAILRVDNFNPQETYYVKLKSVDFDGETTKVVIEGSFASDIRNPNFFLFDSGVSFSRLPADTEVVEGLTPGSNEIKFRNNLLQLSEQIEANSLLQIDSSEIYSVLGISIENEEATVSVFPPLQSYIQGDVFVSDFPVREEGITGVLPKLDVLTDPLQPAFTISFVPPTEPVELSGKGLITIDNEKIILQEIVAGYLNPSPYFYYFKDYSDLYTMAKAIQGTHSTFIGLSYYPFTISPGGEEQYYLGDGAWSTQTIEPFEEGTEEGLPYTLTINPDLYKWKVNLFERDSKNFKIEEVDVSSSYSEGNLIAVKSKITGDIYYHIVQGASSVENETNEGLKDTVVEIKDYFKINFTDPYLYRYDNPLWLNLADSFSIDSSSSTLIFQGDLTRTIRSSMLFKFEGLYVYKVESVVFENDVTTVTLSPDVYKNETLLIKEEFYPGYLQYTDLPLYLDEASHQPSLTFTYTEVQAHIGYAEISIEDDKLTLLEYVDGSETVSKETVFEFSNYQDIYELGEAINNTESYIAGYFPYYVNVEVYDGLYRLGGFEKFTIVPTYTLSKKLPYTALVAQSTFKIDYTLEDSYYTGTASLKRKIGRLILKEELVHNVEGPVEQEYVLPYENYATIYELFSAINDLTSTITGEQPFSVNSFTGEFDPIEFFTRGVYSIPRTQTDEYLTLSQNIPATIDTASWYLQEPQNLRRLILGTGYSVSNGSLSFTSPLKRYERYKLNYLGLNTLSEFEEKDIYVFCRYFGSLSAGSKVEAYMDYLNVDQYYIQKLTERKFLELVTVPQVGDLLQQKGGGGGSGADSGSNDSFPNYQAGNANLYYLLRDEQIKKLLYLKIYKWYKKRLRYFASEAQLSLGFKFANSTHYYKNGSYYSLQDSLVEDDINYTLTTQDAIDEIENGGFSRFFPFDYKKAAPKYYPRFSREYKDYKDVYAYNVYYKEDDVTVGRVRSWKPYWAPKSGDKASDLDYMVLKNASTELVGGYNVPLYSSHRVEDSKFKDELIYDSDSSIFSFLKRVLVGDQIKLEDQKTYYKIGAINNRQSDYLLTESLELEGGKYFKEKNIKTYFASKYQDELSSENETYAYRFSLSAGYLATDREKEEFVGGLITKYGTKTLDGSVTEGTDASGGVLQTINGNFYKIREDKKDDNNIFSVRGINIPKVFIDVYVSIEAMETAFPYRGNKIHIKKQEPESFPVYDDGGNYGVTLSYNEIKGQKTGRNRIRKVPHPVEILKILFFPFFNFLKEPPEIFEFTGGTFDEDTGEYVLGSYNYANDIFDPTDSEAYKQIDLSPLNFIEERKVSDNLDTISNDVVKDSDMRIVSEDQAREDSTGEYAYIDSIKYYGFKEGDLYAYINGTAYFSLNPGDIVPEQEQRGLNRFLDLDFDQLYTSSVDRGYVDAIHFKTKNRDIWFNFPLNSSDDYVNTNYGVPNNLVLKGFYDPENIYTKLVLEKQAWLTEQLIVEDIYDVQLKLARAFKDGILNSGVGAVTEGNVASNIEYSQFRQYLLDIGNIIKTRMEKYKNKVEFLLRNTPDDFGSIMGVLQESGTPDNIPIDDRDFPSAEMKESYERTLEAFNKYSLLLARSFTEANSFYNRIVNSINQWTNSYIRWILSIREGTVFQLSARDNRVDNLVVTGFNLLDAITINYNTNSDEIIITDPQAKVDYDLVNQCLRLVLTATYEQPLDFNNPDVELLSGNVEYVYLFKDYTTLDLLVGAINDSDFPLGIQFFTSEMVFYYYPKGEYTTLRISPFSATGIEPDGFTIEVLNVDDHRQYDSRVLFLEKKEEDLLALTSETPINPWPTYISYYNDPTNSDYSSPENYQPKKAAIQGLKVPGSWEQLPSSYYDVIRFSSVQADYTTSYLVTAVYDKDELNDIVNEQTLNLILPDRSKVSDMVSIINKIDDTGTISVEEYNFIEEVDRSKRTKDIFIKFLTVKLSKFGEEITVRFNTRRFRTINEVVTAMNGYFYKDDSNEWQPAKTSDDITDSKFVRLFDAELIGDPLDQGESSSFEIQVPYESIIKSFKVGPYTDTRNTINPITFMPETEEYEYYLDKENILLGWVPEIRTVDEGQQITLKLNDELEYSPGNTYGFRPLIGEDARLRSLEINSDNPNANILPFDMYSWDTNASFEIRNNWFLMRSDKVKSAIPLTGAIGTVTFVSDINNFSISGSATYPELEGETVGELVGRINTSDAKGYFYANLKFVREPDEENNVGFFEYTYLPNVLSTVPQSTLETIYLADDSEVIRLNPDKAENAQYQMDQITPVTDPPSINNLTINSDAKVFDFSRNTGQYTLTNSTYNINTGSNLISLATDYECNYEYSVELDLSNYASITELINGNGSYDGINDLLAPLLTVPDVNLFSATAIVPSADPEELRVTSTVTLPETLRDISGSNILSISEATIADSRISISSAQVRVTVGKLTLSATLVYTGSYSGNISIAQTVSDVSASLNSIYPLGDDGTYFPPLFNSNIISSAYSAAQATGINGSGGSQTFTTTVTTTVSVSRSYPTTSTLESLVNGINAEYPLTGVSSSYLFTGDPGYKGLDAKYLVPSEGDDYDALNNLYSYKDFGAIYSAEPALNLLFMENEGGYQVAGDALSVTTSLGAQTFYQGSSKDLDGFIDSITGDFLEGFRSVDVLPIKVLGISYGALRDTVPVKASGNEPTHVNFGFLGDIRFYQISDFNLYTELGNIKQRLGKPWLKEDGTFEDDWYNDINYYYDYYGRTGEGTDGNPIAIHSQKFLGYMKNTRFNEIKKSIQDEQLVGNKYLWLYLKFHKEIGCDQKARDLFKRIQEDEEDSETLPQDL